MTSQPNEMTRDQAIARLEKIVFDAMFLSDDVIALRMAIAALRREGEIMALFNELKCTAMLRAHQWTIIFRFMSEISQQPQQEQDTDGPTATD